MCVRNECGGEVGRCGSESSFLMLSSSTGGTDKQPKEICRKMKRIQGDERADTVASVVDLSRYPCNKPSHDSARDIESITNNFLELTMCCFYYGGLSSPQAKLLLKNSQVGTFLIRDSSDPKYLYSLSLKTERGTTSVRIEYFKGKFRLDCEDRLRNQMQTFPTVMKLIDHYVLLSQSEASKECRWLESSGRRDVRVKLTKPRLGVLPSLQHLARVTINSHVPVDKLNCLPLPNKLTGYLKEYPYPH